MTKTLTEELQPLSLDECNQIDGGLTCQQFVIMGGAVLGGIAGTATGAFAGGPIGGFLGGLAGDIVAGWVCP